MAIERAAKVVALFSIQWIASGCAGPRAAQKSTTTTTQAAKPSPAHPDDADAGAAFAVNPDPADGSGERGKRTISIDPAVMENESRGAAWMMYAMVLAGAREKADSEKRKPDWFDDEIEARRTLATFWRQVEPAKRAASKDAYLDVLVRVDDAGFLPEYVVRYLARPGFALDGKRLAALRLDAFEAWAEKNLPADHAGEAHAIVTVEGEPEATPFGAGAGAGARLTDVEQCPLLSSPFAAETKAWSERVAAASQVIVPARSGEEFVGALRDPALKPRLAEKGVAWGSPDLEALFLGAGFCAIENGALDDARRYFDALLAIDPLDEKAASELAHVYIANKQWDVALHLIDGQLGRVRGDCARAVLFRKRGFVLFEELQLRDARAAYVKSLEYDPGSELAREEIRLIDERRRDKGMPAEPVPPPLSGGRASSEIVGKGEMLPGATNGEMEAAVPPAQTIRTRCEEK